MTPLQRCQLLAAFLLLCTQFATHLFVEADVLSTTNVQTPVLRWERVDIPPNAPKPSPRKDFVFVFDEQKQSGVLFGGRTSDGNVLDDTWILDIQGRRWTQIDKPIRPPARFGAVAAADQPDTSNRRSIVIFGGKGPNGEIYNDVWGFDTTDSLWYPTKPKGQTPPPMYGAIGGIAPRAPGQEEKLRLLATYGSDDKNLFTDTWVLTLTGQAINYTTVNAEWTKISTSEARPTARTSFGGTVLPGDRVLLYGGCVKGGWGNCPNNEAWVLSPNGVSLTTEGGWKRLDSCPRPRLNAAITHRPDYNTGKPRAQAFMFGGFYSRGSGNPGEVSFIDADLGAWTNIIPISNDNQYPEQRSGAGFISKTRDNLAILFGGESASGPLNDLWFLYVYADKSSSPNNVDNKEIVACFVPSDLRVTHGALMVTGLGVLLPLSIFIARYAKPKKSRKNASNPSNQPMHSNFKSKLWLYLHSLTSVLSVVFTIAGIIIAYQMQDLSHLNTPHSYIGVFISLLFAVIIVTSFFMPRASKSSEQAPSNTQDPSATIKSTLRQFKDATRRAKNRVISGSAKNGVRKSSKITFVTIWKSTHITMGLVLFYATILNIILGLVLLNPAFTYYLIYIIFLLTLFVIYVVLTVLGRPSKKNWSVKMFNRLFRGKQSRRRRRSSAVGLHARTGSSGEGGNGIGGSASGVLNGDVIMEEDETEDSDDSEYDDGDEVNVGEGEAEEELSKREVVIMTIPKRRLTVVNA